MVKKSQEQVSFACGLRRTQTDAEKALWARLRNRQLDGMRFRRQQPIGPYVVDFVCLERKLIVEIDGGQHNEEETVIRDDDRTRWLRGRHYQVLRFWNNEVMTNPEGVLQRIKQAVAQSAPSP
jgi:very-short-patch-repair endonuclease